jgi:hypothetical protein
VGEGLLLLFAILLIHPGRSQAQFVYAPVSGTLTVPFVMDSATTAMPGLFPSPMRAPTERVAEFVGDPAGAASPTAIGAGVPWASQRIAANAQMRYRIFGNPYLRRAGITFDHFAMNIVAPADHITLGWLGASPATLFGNPGDFPHGNWLTPVTTTVYESGGNSLMFPGMVFRVVTGPDIPHTSIPGEPDRESWGFQSASINVWGNGTQGDTTLPTIGLYDSGVVILAANNDVVRMLAANTGHPITIAVWAPPGAYVPSVTVYGRCGMPPTATAYDRRAIFASPGRAVFQMSPCTTNQALHLAVTNQLTGGPRAVRIYMGSNRTDRDYNLRIGVAFNANAAQLDALRGKFSRAAWMFFGLTGGTIIMRSFTLFNNATNCSTTPSTACSGNACDACVFQNPGATAFCHETVGRLHLYEHNNERTIAHEMGHCFTRNGGIDGLRDEYERNRCGAQPANCSHTWMGVYEDNRFQLCTDATHGRTGIHSVLNRSQDRLFQGCDPLESWGYFGNPPGTTSSQDSGWTWLNGRIPAAFPSDRTPEVLWMERFWNSTLIGAFTN